MNRLTKYLIPSFVACSLLLCNEASASSRIDKDKVSGSITVYTSRTDLVEDGVFARYEKEFKEKYPNVTSVKVVAFADYQSGLRPRMNTADFGDVVFILPSVPSSQYSNFYLPLTDMYQKDEIYYYDAWKNNLDIYGISSGNSVEGIVYNKQVLQKARVPTPIRTLKDLYVACEKVKKIHKTPFFINFGAQWPLQQFDKLPLLIEGNDRVYENMLNQLDPFSNKQSSYYKSLKILKTLIDKQYVEKDLMSNLWEDSKMFFVKGDIAMLYLGQWIIPQLVDKGANSDNIGFMPFPADDGDYLKAEMTHDWAYAVSKYSKNPETAKAFIKFMLEDSDYNKISGFIPTVKSIKPQVPQLFEFMSYKPEIIDAPENSARFIEATNKSKIDFFTGGYIQDLMTARDFDKALKKLDSRWTRALEMTNDL